MPIHLEKIKVDIAIIKEVMESIKTNMEIKEAMETNVYMVEAISMNQIIQISTIKETALRATTTPSSQAPPIKSRI